MIKFKSLSSGSCGNCYFLGTTAEDGTIEEAILIDAGVSLRRLKKELAKENISIECIKAVLVTHDHLDHIRSLGSYCKYVPKPVWATSTLHRALSRHTMTKDHVPDCRKVLKDDDWTEIIPGRIKAKYFVVPHDATQTVGYGIVINGYKFVIMTDIGRMTAEALEYAHHADTVVVESNYDIGMLMGGPYTYELKMRICKGNGHLSNDECAEAISKFWHPDLRHIFLCHLSENNNTPELAYEANIASLKELDAVGKTSLITLPRQVPSPVYILQKNC